MEGNSLVKEITPEEVKTIDPFEISYIAMKDGSIIMVIEKNIKIENNFTLVKEKKEQNSPDFNLKGKKYISYTNQKNEKYQKENEEDYNVYYSNNKNMNILNNGNKSELNNNKENTEENINNFSFYSNDDIHRNYVIKKEKNNNKIEIEYINSNENKDNKEPNLNEAKGIINNNIDFISINNKDNKNNPYCVIKRKYYFYKKSNENNKSIKENKENNNVNKTYSYNTPQKRQNNLYIIKNNNTKKDNISINYSKYSINNNRNSRIPDSKHTKNSTNLICTCPIIYNTCVNENSEINKTTNNNAYNNNYHYYDTYHKSKFDNFDINDYSFNKYQNHSFLSSKADDIQLEKGNNHLRSITPFYSIKDLRRTTKNNKKMNNMKNKLELRKCLSKDNHKYYERKEVRGKKQSTSNYIKMKDFNGKTIHIFENK